MLLLTGYESVRAMPIGLEIAEFGSLSKSALGPVTSWVRSEMQSSEL